MKVCYFGTYDRDYPRNKIIRKGLIQNGAEVVECRVNYSRFKRYPELILKFFTKVKDCDAIIVGEAGQVNVPIAKIIANGRPIILDAFFSWYDTLINDRKEVRDSSFRASILHLEDEYCSRLSDVIILDTYEHIKYFKQEFLLKDKKFVRVLVGADDEIFYPRDSKNEHKCFCILFYGSYLPLHGTRYIIEAANLLQSKSNREIVFKLIGNGPTFRETKDYATQLNIKNVEFHPHVKLEELPYYITMSDVCLGIFGDTRKAKRVIPHKVYQALAMGKPVITGDSLASREILTNEENAILVEFANPNALADAVLFLNNDTLLREKIASNGYELFRNNFTPKIIGKNLVKVLEESI